MAEMNYQSYLKIDELLSLQNPVSRKKESQPAHDEMLFIIVHQTYELWFKQILFELERILSIFSGETIPERKMGTIFSGLYRITEIQRVLLAQLDVLETMTPMDFLEFRDDLRPASGFQSIQFRTLEKLLGVPVHENRTPDTALSLFSCVEQWLERTPFLTQPGFAFWDEYAKAISSMYEADSLYILSEAHLSEAERTQRLRQIEKMKDDVEGILNKTSFESAREKGVWRLSFEAIRAALFIFLYREEPILQLPFRMLTALMDLDEEMAKWRSGHALMVHRMIGGKIGTGASSGYEYLLHTIQKRKVFSDFMNLSSFFVPTSHLPDLPIELRRKLSFFFETASTKGS